MNPEYVFALVKRAYAQRLVQAHTFELEKRAQFGTEGTLRFSPGRAALGGLAGAGAGYAGSDMGNLEGYQRALAIGGPALAGALFGGFSQPTYSAVEEQLMMRQLEAQKNDAMDQYKAQMSGGDLAQ